MNLLISYNLLSMNFSFDTSSTAMNFSLFQLASNQGIQEKARKEIEDKIAKHDGKLSYEALMEMEYLNQIFSGMFLFQQYN